MLTFLRKILSGFLLSLILLPACLFGYSSEKLHTIQSVSQVADGLYTMDYVHDYDIDKMLKRGVSNHVQLLLKGFAEIMGSELPGFGCTTFNAVSPNGEYLFGRNFDYPDADLMLVWTHPKNGYASVSSVSLVFMGYDADFLPNDTASRVFTLLAPYAPLDGINEKGLSIAVLELEKKPVFQRTCKPDLTTTTMIRAVLDKAATTQEAIEIFRSFDMRDFLLAECTYHYQISDARGESVVIEYVDGQMQVIYPEERQNAAVEYLVATNFFLSPGVDDPDGMGYDRSETVYNALNACGGVTTPAEAMGILQNTGMENEDLHGYICSTLWSIVYNQSKRTMDVCVHNRFDRVYTFSVNDPQVLQ